MDLILISILLSNFTFVIKVIYIIRWYGCVGADGDLYSILVLGYTSDGISCGSSIIEEDRCVCDVDVTCGAAGVDSSSISSCVREETTGGYPHTPNIIHIHRSSIVSSVTLKHTACYDSISIPQVESTTTTARVICEAALCDAQ